MTTTPNSVDDRREVVRIMGDSRLPSAQKSKELGVLATYEASFLKALTDLPDNLVHRLRKALAADIGGFNFLSGVADVIFGPTLGGWLRVPSLSGVPSRRLDSLLRYAKACEHAPAHQVFTAAKMVGQWEQEMNHEDATVAVSVVAAALVYADRNEPGMEVGEGCSIVRYALDHRQRLNEITAAISERGWDVELVEVMLGAPAALREGSL